MSIVQPLHAWSFLAAVLLLCAGCSSLLLPPQPESTHFFILNAVVVPTSRSSSQTAVGLGPVGFPQYLSREAMVTRSADNSIQFSTRDQWAEPLDVNFKRVLTQDLSRSLGGANVIPFPYFSATPPFRYRVEITVNSFETAADGTAHLSANWSVIDIHENRVVYASSSNIRIPAAPGAASGAAALSQAAAQFAQQIAAELKDVRDG